MRKLSMFEVCRLRTLKILGHPVAGRSSSNNQACIPRRYSTERYISALLSFYDMLQ